MIGHIGHREQWEDLNEQQKLPWADNTFDVATLALSATWRHRYTDLGDLTLEFVCNIYIYTYHTHIQYILELIVYIYIYNDNDNDIDIDICLRCSKMQ